MTIDQEKLRKALHLCKSCHAELKNLIHDVQPWGDYLNNHPKNVQARKDRMIKVANHLEALLNRFEARMDDVISLLEKQGDERDEAYLARDAAKAVIDKRVKICNNCPICNAEDVYEEDDIDYTSY